jgi:hypothetical protein
LAHHWLEDLLGERSPLYLFIVAEQFPLDHFNAPLKSSVVRQNGPLILLGYSTQEHIDRTTLHPS